MFQMKAAETEADRFMLPYAQPFIRPQAVAIIQSISSWMYKYIGL